MKQSRSMMRAWSKMRGVTLMELLIVIVIIGILAAIAVPSYRRYLIRSQRSEAKIALMQLQTAEEKYYLQFNAYTSNITGAVNSATPGLGLLSTTETGKYDVAVALADATAQGYTATASPRTGGGQTDDADCANFTITDRGTRNVSGSSGAQTCWK
jgi:type IV pilus assembly protein PilE